MCDVLLADPVFVSWIKDSPKFDLFIIDALINECAYGMAHVHGAKVIVYNTAIPFPWYIDPFGFPDESAWVPDFVFHYPPATINFAQVIGNPYFLVRYLSIKSGRPSSLVSCHVNFLMKILTSFRKKFGRLLCRKNCMWRNTYMHKLCRIMHKQYCRLAPTEIFCRLMLTFSDKIIVNL